MRLLAALANKVTRSIDRWVLLATVSLALAPTTALAQHSSADSFISRSYRGRDVLRVDCNLELPPSMSFGNMRVRISNTKRPSRADRNLLVVFYTKQWGSHSGETMSYRVPVLLPEGARSVTVDIPHVQRRGQSSWDVAVFEDGRDIEDKRQKPRNQQDYQWTYHDNQDSAFAAIAGTGELSASVNDSLQTMADAIAINKQPANNRGVRNFSTTTGAKVVPIQEAHTDWRRYFPYSAWTLSAQTVSEVNQRYPDVAKAIRTYVAAGGTLVIHGATESEHMAAIDSFLNIPSSNSHSPSWSSIKYPKSQWWWQTVNRPVAIAKGQGQNAAGTTNTNTEEADVAGLSYRGAAYDAALAAETWLQGSLGNHLDNMQQLSTLLGTEGPAIGGSGTLGRYRVELLKTLDTEQLLKRDYVNGAVLLTSKSLAEVPRQLLRQTLSVREQTDAHTTTSSEMDSNWFWKNLISAVGKPPVWTFCVIVSLFGAVLGPGLLFLTGRIGRRSLMIFLVPSISLFATSAIILYGVLHEGFDTHVRVTSVQTLDPSANFGFAWSRQNYFSGLPPREGLQFRSDTYARPVYSEESRRYGDPNPRRNVGCSVNLTDRQNWRGWLGARQQQQLIIGHPIESVSVPVRLEGTRAGLLVTNQTQEELPFVIVRGADEDYYFVEELAAGATAELPSEDMESVAAYVSRAVLNFRPKPPPELEEGGSLLEFGSGRRRRQTYRNYESGDVINTAFRKYMSDRLDMPPFGFATVLRESDAIEIPLEGTRSDDLHIVIGVQPW